MMDFMRPVLVNGWPCQSVTAAPPTACALRIRRLPTSVGLLGKQHDQRRLVASLIYLSQLVLFSRGE